jgi:alpha-tubulin suppressor-like RCC1 family protein
LLGLLSLSACGSNVGTAQGLLVTVENPSLVPGIVSLRVVLSNAGISDTLTFPATAQATPIVFPTSFSVTVPATRNGNVDLAISGINGQGAVVASGAASRVLNEGTFASVSVSLQAGAPSGTGGSVGAGGSVAAGGAVGSGGAVGAGGASGFDAFPVDVGSVQTVDVQGTDVRTADLPISTGGTDASPDGPTIDVTLGDSGGSGGRGGQLGTGGLGAGGSGGTRDGGAIGTGGTAAGTAYTVSATVTGLTGSGLVLQNKGTDDLAVTGNGRVTFNTPIASGATYAVTIKTQPTSPAQTCGVSNGSGTVGTADIGNVTVTCVSNDTDTRPLSLSISPAPNAAMGTLAPYVVSEAQDIPLTSVKWYFDDVAGGVFLPGVATVALHSWNTPGAHTIRVTATASNGRSAQASIGTFAVDSPLASGAGHTCALTATGAAMCWGSGINGALGNKASQDQGAPVDVADLAGLLGLAAGDGHTCALKADHSVACWGDNTEGQLGNTTTFHGGTNPSPATVTGLGGVVSVVAGRYHTCALRSDGTVACFGRNSSAELGSAAVGTQSATPVNVAGISDAVAISAGRGSFTCALKSDQTVVCWGNNESGQLGTGQSTPSQTGTPQTVLTGQGTPLGHVLALRSGALHSCAIVEDGSVYCWGNNSYQQTSPDVSNVVYPATKQPGLSGVLMLSTSMYSTCSFSIDSSFKCWGSNSYGESLGAAGGASHVLAPTAISGLQGTQLPEYASGGNEFLCALQSDGTALCLGRGGSGQLGDGMSVDSPEPVQVQVGLGTFWTWLGT